MYLTGEGIRKDIFKAQDLYTKAANQGHAESHYRLGMMYKDKLI